MIAMKSVDVENAAVGTVPYKGGQGAAVGVEVRWLSRAGRDAQGGPAYGLRLFTIAPGGEIPIHNHSYEQTMYILSGRFECWEFDADSDEITNSAVCGPGDLVYIPSMEPHGMRNLSDTEAGQFLCCICTLDESGPCAG